MSEPVKTAPITKYRRAKWKAARNWWPLLIFITIAFLAVILYNNGGKYRVMAGTAERIVESVSPLETARVAALQVQVGDRVQAGDVIVQLDTTIIDAEGAVLKERVEQSRLETRLEQLTLERQFASALQEAEQALREANMKFKLSRVEHVALLKELERLEPLYKQKLIEAEIFVAKAARQDVLSESLKLMPAHLEALKSEVERASSQKASAMARLEEMNLSANENSSNEAVNLFDVRRDRYTLRAQRDGVVSSIEQQPGDVVQPGIPIVSILVDGPSRIEGFLPENNLSAIAMGTPANVYPTVSMRQVGVIRARVVQISPAVYSLPGRASPIRGQVVRGRRVTFALDEEVDLVPGETVSIEIESSLFESPSLEN